ncbi:MAG: transposase family protein [Marinobacter psychrophilus]|nr:transposase family protein [Marinobacter psychrophilus]
MPTTHVARKPNQVRSWGITYLPLPVRGQYYYLYLIKDIYSRKAVGWEVHLAESGDEAAALLQRSVLSEKCLRDSLVLHSDNGAPMKSATLLAKMYDLGITPPWSGRRDPGMASFAVSAGSILRTKYPLCSRWRSTSLMNCFLICSWSASSVERCPSSVGYRQRFARIPIAR